MSWAEVKKALNTSLGTEHEVALNERPYSVLVKDKVLGVVTYNNVITNKVNANLNELVVGENEIFMFVEYYRDSSSSTDLTSELYSYDGTKFITLGGGYRGNYNGSQYAARDITTNKVYFSKKSENVIYQSGGVTATAFTTLNSKALYFYIKQPYIIYSSGGGFIKRDIGLSTETPIPMPTPLKSTNLIWNYGRYIYYVNTSYEIVRLDVDTLEFVNLTEINGYRKVEGVSQSIKNANGTFITFGMSTSHIKYVVDIKTAYVEENIATVHVPPKKQPYSKGARYAFINDNLVMIDTTRQTSDTYIYSVELNYRKVSESINLNNAFFVTKHSKIISTDKIVKELYLGYCEIDNQRQSGYYLNQIDSNGMYGSINPNCSITIL